MKNTWSAYSVLFVVIIGFLVNSDFKLWKNPERVIENDVRNYYGYLPAKYIYDDIKVERDNYQYSENGYWFWVKYYDSGKYNFGKTYGVALLYSPFFATANIAAKLFEYPVTGFSEPYKYFLLLSALFYFMLGLLIVRKMLLYLKFQDTIIAATILLLGLGTNLFAYSTQSGPYPHVYCFFLIAVFIYFTIKYHDSGTWSDFLPIAASYGLILLISLPDAVIALFFIFYKTKTATEVSEKRMDIRHVVTLFLLLLIIWWPQFRYWKLTTGSPFGATDYSEKYFFSDPQFIKGLFSFRKGWLLYTPLMTFALIGLYFLYKQMGNIFNAVLICIVASIYITFSWWNWWYGGSYGQRALIDIYALLTIPLAAFLSAVLLKPNRAVKTVVVIIGGLFVWLNLFQTYQYEKGSLHYCAMSKKLYFMQFAKLDKVKDFDKYLDFPSDSDAKGGKR